MKEQREQKYFFIAFIYRALRKVVSQQTEHMNTVLLQNFFPSHSVFGYVDMHSEQVQYERSKLLCIYLFRYRCILFNKCSYV